MYIKRQLNLAELLQRKSYFLLGPRQTGKTFLVQQSLSQYKTYNLLKTDEYLKLSHSPHRLREELTDQDQIVIIDEIQKLPILLDEVQCLIDEKGVRFLLTGSSARKLRRKGINMLGGRARIKRFHPFIFRELKGRFDLEKALDMGLIPSIYLSEEPYEDMVAYVGNYLKEEVAAEAIVRNVPAFSRFLTVAGLSNGKLINYSKLANDAQVPKSTVQEYYQILRDTLLGSDLPPWKETVKRKPVMTSKFYFFDVGVARFLQNRRGVMPGSPEFGEAFEAYIYHELKAYCDYTGKGNMFFWRSTSGFEVDFILGDSAAIEVKAKGNVGDRDLKGLRALKEEQNLRQYLMVCLEDVTRVRDGVHVLPWRVFLDNLWLGKYG